MINGWAGRKMPVIVFGATVGGDVAQWLGCRSLAGGLSLVYA